MAKTIAIRIAVSGPGGSCAENLPAGRFELEDVDVVLDAACAP